MACFSPLKGWRSQSKNKETGKRPITFTRSEAYTDLPVEVPCGQCSGCRLERARQWAIRCTHEASMHENNCFITLTFNDKHLPKDKSLDVKHFQKFMKRLRKRYGNGIRFFHCGEYGEQFGRPHYHACLFNFDFPDKVLWKENHNGDRIYTSKALDEIWGFGFTTIGDVTFQSASYVARYIMKKINGKEAEEHYQGRKPEYTTMSRRPGIGATWYEKYKDEVYPSDFIIMNGAKMRPPKFYDLKLEHEYPVDLKKIKKIRVDNSLKHAENNTYDRLIVREKCHKAKTKQLVRPIE